MGESEWIDKKSRFLGVCIPLSGPDEAEDHLRQLRAQHAQATHVVSAWQTMYPERTARYSDDGEPQGTAGRPVLDVLTKQGIDQAAIYVVRYFGGTLLGAGGLVRAYSKTAAAALEAATPLTMVLREKYRLTAPYACFDPLRYRLEAAGYVQGEAEFGVSVVWTVALAPEERDAFLQLVADTSRGEASAAFQTIDYAPLL